MEKYGAGPYTFRLVEEMPSQSVFKFRDTLTSRVQIADLSSNFADDVVAVIGLGGTGSYVLDFLVKTPVKEIRGFDLDDFHMHTAYRSPGRPQESELGKRKPEVYQSRYDNFRLGLSLQPNTSTPNRSRSWGVLPLRLFARTRVPQEQASSTCWLPTVFLF
jgi:hypothetical protein